MIRPVVALLTAALLLGLAGCGNKEAISDQISRHVFAFLPKHGGYELAGKLHMLCAYWGFVLMRLHLGIHCNMLLTMARKNLRPNKVRTWTLRIIGYLFAVYGIVAFIRCDVGLYLLLISHFVFFDYSELLILLPFRQASAFALPISEIK